MPRPPGLDAALRCAGGVACIALLAGGAAAADPQLLPPEQAFRFSARALDAHTLEASFTVADGYYLYRDKLAFSVGPDATTLVAVLPPGKIKEDQFFGKVETYRGLVTAKLPLEQGMAGQAIKLSAESQGCADVGVCYPPTRQQVTLVLPPAGKGPGPVVEANPAKKNWFN
jgi:thioredoxin:protein disulfide reductase